MTITKEEFFKIEKPSPRDKAAATDEAARQIILTAEAERAKKTERLRKLREAQEAAKPAAKTTTKRTLRARAS